ELEEQLRDIVYAGDRGQPDLLLNVGYKLEETLSIYLEDTPLPLEIPSISNFHDTLSLLVSTIKDTLDENPARSRGTLVGTRYPGLSALVFGLQRAACLAGGKFTAHRTDGEKGTLIAALNAMRSFFLRYSDGVWAECLPPPGSHPVAAYERQLR